MPQYYRYCSITISQAAGEKRSYNSSKTQRSSLHDFSSPMLKLLLLTGSDRKASKRVISFPSSCCSNSLAGTSGIVSLPVFQSSSLPVFQSSSLPLFFTRQAKGGGGMKILRGAAKISSFEFPYLHPHCHIK